MPLRRKWRAIERDRAGRSSGILHGRGGRRLNIGSSLDRDLKSELLIRSPTDFALDLAEISEILAITLSHCYYSTAFQYSNCLLLSCSSEQRTTLFITQYFSVVLTTPQKCVSPSLLFKISLGARSLAVIDWNLRPSSPTPIQPALLIEDSPSYSSPSFRLSARHVDKTTWE